MNRILQIIAGFALLMILGAPSCVNEEEQNILEESRLQREIDEIYSEAESMVLSDSLLLCYSIIAKEKMMDIFDYMALMSDTSLDQNIRFKAAQILKQNFLSGEVQIQFAENDSRAESLDFYIKKILLGQTPLSPFAEGPILINQVLQASPNGSYRGSLIFDPTKSEANPSTHHITADFYLIKEEKIFGSDTLNIWEIRFGNIM